MSSAPSLISTRPTGLHPTLPPPPPCPSFSPSSKRCAIRPRKRLCPPSDPALQKDPNADANKAIKEYKDGNTGLPFNMEYSAIAALLDVLKDANAIDDRKMLVSCLPRRRTQCAN